MKVDLDSIPQNLIDNSGLPRPSRAGKPAAGGDLNIFDLHAYWMFCHPAYQGSKGLAAAVRAKRMRLPRKGKYPVIFINGIQPSPEKHTMQAMITSAVSGGPVFGIYNAGNTKGTTSKIDDLMHCASLKTVTAIRKSASARIDKAIEHLTGLHGIAQQNLRELLSKEDPASAKLFDCLCSGAFDNVRICAHSQGNIITCNALNAYVALKGKDAIARMRVYAFGSPVTFWSEADAIVRKYEFSNDAVTWFAMNTTSGSGVRRQGFKQVGMSWNEAPLSEVPTQLKTNTSLNPGNLFTHSYFLYMQELWDLLVNEFD